MVFRFTQVLQRSRTRVINRRTETEPKPTQPDQFIMQDGFFDCVLLELRSAQPIHQESEKPVQVAPHGFRSKTRISMSVPDLRVWVSNLPSSETTNRLPGDDGAVVLAE